MHEVTLSVVSNILTYNFSPKPKGRPKCEIPRERTSSFNSIILKFYKNSAEFTPNDGSEAFGDGNIHYSAREFGPHGPFNNVSGKSVPHPGGDLYPI